MENNYNLCADCSHIKCFCGEWESTSDAIPSYGAFFITDMSWESYVRRHAAHPSREYSEQWIQEVLADRFVVYKEEWLSIPWSFPTKGTNTTIVILDNLVAFSNMVFEVYRTGSYYTGHSVDGARMINLMIRNNFLYIRVLYSNANVEIQMQLQKNNLITRSNLHPETLPELNSVLGILFWYYEYSRVAIIEVKHHASQEFIVVEMIHSTRGGEFHMNRIKQNLEQGINTIRITHVGGPFIEGTAIKLRLNSAPFYINMEKDANGNITIQ